MNQIQQQNNISTKSSSEELSQLLQHQREINEWMASVKFRIYELETTYLDEPNSMGNIIRGWDADGRIGPIKRQISDEKDRLFSNSSYQVWSDIKSLHDSEFEKKQNNIVKTESIASSLQKGPKHKKSRRSGSLSSPSLVESESWADHGDY